MTSYNALKKKDVMRQSKILDSIYLFRKKIENHSPTAKINLFPTDAAVIYDSK